VSASTAANVPGDGAESWRGDVRICVDPEVCQGHALCNSVDPDFFTLDDVGYSNVGVREVPPGKEEVARRGVLTCPEGAITIEE
jgi:ferredoxin